jgi:hypothetical protein
MPFNLLLLPLLGGYIFARKYYRSRYFLAFPLTKSIFQTTHQNSIAPQKK